MHIIKKRNGKVLVIGRKKNVSVNFDLKKKMSEDFMCEYVNRVSARVNAVKESLIPYLETFGQESKCVSESILKNVSQVSECDHRTWAHCVCGL